MLSRDDRPPIILDMGTGLRVFGRTHDNSVPFEGTVLLSHLHWDHVQGLPFFAPMHFPGAQMNIFGPKTIEQSLEDSFRVFMHPPFFPIELEALAGQFRFHELWNEQIDHNGVSILALSVPHTGETLGFRITTPEGTVAYIPDHQQPVHDITQVADTVLELAGDVDLLIHDGQYTDEEFEQRTTWGHCTVDYAVQVAAQAGSKKLMLFHHDPAHSDDELDMLLQKARAAPRADEIPVIVSAHEGLTIEFD